MNRRPSATAPARLVLLALLAGGSLAGIDARRAAAQDAAPERTPGPQAALVRRAVRIPLADGGALAADVLAPADDARRPAIVVQTPYGREHFRPDAVLDDVDGYAFVVVDVRGRHGSRDVPTRPGYDVRRRDGFDTVEWVAAQPFCDGHVGTWGPSALGQQQFRTAEAAPPHLRCAVPIVSGFGWRYGTFHPGGVLREEYARTIDRLGFGAGGLIREHPLDDVAWKFVARAAAPERVAVPTLMIGGWYDLHGDELPADFATLVARSAPAVRDAHRLLIGPWTHHFTASSSDAATAAHDAATVGVARAAVAAWFGRWLRGVAAPPTPRVRYAVLGTDRWETADAWPPASAPTTLFLAPDGALVDAPPSTATSAAPFAVTSVAFPHDPAAPVPTVGGANLDPALPSGPRDQRRGVLDHPGVVAFATAPRTTPLALRGAVRATLVVAVTASDPASPTPLDADVHVRLCDVAPDGTATLLADAARRMSLRGSFASRQPVVAGAAYDVELVFPDLAADVAAGHHLLVAVAGSNAPRYEVSPTPVRVELRLGGPAGSRVVLPVR